MNADEFRQWRLADTVCAAAEVETHGPVTVQVNAADDPPASLYLTVTGTSAEAGDDGRPAAAIARTVLSLRIAL